MRILLDHNLDWRLKRLLPDHDVRSTKEMGWERLTNGQLLAQAEAHFDVMLTVDRNIRHQHNLAGRNIAIIVLIAANNTRNTLAPLFPEVERLLPAIAAGQFYDVSLP
jgi:predicted nuclease of predicted toxin-antitoxin system